MQLRYRFYPELCSGPIFLFFEPGGRPLRFGAAAGPLCATDIQAGGGGRPRRLPRPRATRSRVMIAYYLSLRPELLQVSTNQSTSRLTHARMEPLFTPTSDPRPVRATRETGLELRAQAYE
jgi:hypothetical protein